MSRKCINCGTTKDIHRHHVVPLAAGGIDSEKNTVYLCEYCHALVHPWMRDQKIVPVSHTIRCPIDPRYLWIGEKSTHYTRIYGGKPQPLCMNVKRDTDMQFVKVDSMDVKPCHLCKRRVECRHADRPVMTRHGKESLTLGHAGQTYIQEMYERMDVEFDALDLDSAIVEAYLEERKGELEELQDLTCSVCDRVFMTTDAFIDHVKVEQ